jgi:hypothetical protein
VSVLIPSEKCLDNIQLRPQTLPSTSFAIDYSVIILWFDNNLSLRKLIFFVLHSFFLPFLSPSSFLPRRMRFAGQVARMEEKRNAYRILVGKPEGKRWYGLD